MRKRPSKADLDAMKIDPEPGWVLAEKREKNQPESLWLKYDQDRAMSGITSPVAAPDGLQPPPTRGVKAGSAASNQGKVSVQSQLQPLLVKSDVACLLLGGISKRSLSRLEARKLVRPVTGLLRHKLYLVDELRLLVAKHKNWAA